MTQTNAETPGLIALDWGTSSLRAYLLGAASGTVLDRRAGPWGVTRVPEGDFAAVLDAVIGAWRARSPGLPAIASGMIGSSRGWVDVPYCSCPAGLDELAAALASVPDDALRIVPGLVRPGDAPDVMRGEETEILGALALRPELALRSVLVLPGTHSKWVTVAGGRIENFATYMTGELFAVLRDHSILGGAARDAAVDDAAVDDTGVDETRVEETAVRAAFARGVTAARESAGGLAPILFSARALVVTGRLAAGASLDYVSGMLIGDELRCGLAGMGVPAVGATPDAALRIALVGDAALCRRYAAAFRLWGVGDVAVVDGAAPAGLWRIARRAALVARARGGA
ncbi:MAG TPA: 2-dehydro-3-deoxygalactonokinase [Gemmatirosa sp.]